MAAPSLPAPPARSNVYQCVPHLGPARPSDQRPALLPQRGGWPGLVYFQCPVQHLRAAEQAGWYPIVDSRGRPSESYTIAGPAGSIDMVLLAAGEILRGIAPESSRQSCLIHRDVYEVTGLDWETGFPPKTEASVEAQAYEQGLVPDRAPCGRLFAKKSQKDTDAAIRLHTKSCKDPDCRAAWEARTGGTA